jgi:hypothetical protein
MTGKKIKKRKKWPKGVQIAWQITKYLMFPVLCAAVVFAGLRIGYVNIGGGDPADVLKWDTCKHVIDLVFSDS